MTSLPVYIVILLLLVTIAVFIIVGLRLLRPEHTNGLDPAQLRTRTRDWIACACFLLATFVIALGQGQSALGALGYAAPISLFPALGVLLWYRKRMATRARKGAAWAFWTLALTGVITFAAHR